MKTSSSAICAQMGCRVHRAEAHLGPMPRGRQEVLRIERSSGVPKPPRSNPGSRIAEVIDDRTAWSSRRHFDHFSRIEARSVLHSIQEHLPEGPSSADSRCSLGTAAWYSAMKRTSPLCGQQVAGDAHVNQSGGLRGPRCRRASRSPPSALRIMSTIRRSSNGMVKHEQVGAQGGNHLLALACPASTITRTPGRTPRARRQRQVLGHRLSGIGQDDIHGAIANAAQRLDGARAAVNLVLAQPRAGDERAGELVVVADQKNTTHDDGCRLQIAFRPPGRRVATPGASARDISLEAPHASDSGGLVTPFGVRCGLN